MANQNQNSFIPKGSFSQSRSRMESSIGLINLIAFIVLGAVLLFSAGAFMYQYWLLNSLNRPCDSAGGCGLAEEFNREMQDLDVSAVTRLVNLDSKMRSARSVVNNHITLVPLLNLVEQNTLHSVRFSNFEFSRSGGDLKMSGIARSYEDMALQSRIFRSAPGVRQVSFSGFGGDDQGNIRFNVSLTIDESILKYQTSRN